MIPSPPISPWIHSPLVAPPRTSPPTPGPRAAPPVQPRPGSPCRWCPAPPLSPSLYSLPPVPHSQPPCQRRRRRRQPRKPPSLARLSLPDLDAAASPAPPPARRASRRPSSPTCLCVVGPPHAEEIPFFCRSTAPPVDGHLHWSHCIIPPPSAQAVRRCQIRLFNDVAPGGKNSQQKSVQQWRGRSVTRTKVVHWIGVIPSIPSSARAARPPTMQVHRSLRAATVGAGETHPPTSCPRLWPLMKSSLTSLFTIPGYCQAAPTLLVPIPLRLGVLYGRGGMELSTSMGGELLLRFRRPVKWLVSRVVAASWEWERAL
ncbi:proline-rich protein 36-like isoform X2 [Triticum dicoccoides]|uniref:proline-rich protein 36-like isoform X2 n=1 Tax=Triticum dicoccoides TaxID=85692 RepID=UPI001891A3CC|nr:proline-rich protein 36-like isoform X2 [Triticum dicoccoides]